ncbi:MULTISPECIES: alpha/beta fold hydrolase [unclassified Sphingopyxis]|jgi:homoserine O-acetyltransferase/O-succinyltransferase|uniref:alpha/beta fold hydrolase n=1 Tax=unclassified Sphingopyxis TaxID=2614943 RepID=UPI00285CA38E|nr:MULTISPECIES: alpha/beta fold hydrolase [unclassified Sphingopyxis]MDR6831803.1 homoserine O-acetyltransferase [Sphingopyxis sp. BE122]MDR7227545.1 homoserine O-acetyltransferase [Sphingopyxis sp. BE259]
MRKILAPLALLLTSVPAHAQTPTPAGAAEGDAILKDFAFASGEKLPELKMHYTTLGTPQRDAKGHVTNAVMILHGTGGTGKQFFQPQFASELFGRGQLLDTAKYYVILPDNIGHGGSSKPSDGLRMKFPQYDYDDMVAAQHRMLTEKLGVHKLKLILGTSMGCMHAFVWGTTRPGFAEKLAPFACLPVEIAGQNRMWRTLSIDAIKADPRWQGGSYTSPPAAGLRTAASLSLIAGANPYALQVQYPTREAAEKYKDEAFARTYGRNDANDTIYQLDSSRTYNPWPLLEKINVPTLWINSADDFINPPAYGITEQAASRMNTTKFILIPASPETKGHGTHTWAKFWKDDLAKLMAE